MSVGVIGSGRMAQALIRGFLRQGLLRPNQIVMSDVEEERLNEVAALGVHATVSNKAVVERSDMVFIAVKPNQVRSVLVEIAPDVNSTPLLVSVAAGINISMMERALPRGARVIRVMPNTPCMVGEGVSMMSRGKNATDADIRTLHTFLASVGFSSECSESLMDAVCGLSGSGPAFALTAIEAMSDAGVKLGLTRQSALQLAAQTMLGAAKMVLEQNAKPGELRDQICSPGGTTIYGMHALESGTFRKSLIDAVEAAANRSKELSLIAEASDIELAARVEKSVERVRQING